MDFVVVFLLERRSERSCAVLPQKHHDAFVWKGKWPPGAEETQMGSSSNSRGSSLAWPANQCQKPDLLFTVLIERWGKALLFMWWESAALLTAVLSVFLRSCWFFSRVQSPLFILKQWQSLCSSSDNTVAVSVQNIHSSSVWPPLPASACAWWVGGEWFPFAKLPL